MVEPTNDMADMFVALAVRRGWRGPQDDLRQTVWLAMLEAARRFDPSRGVKFESFATFYVKWRVRELYRNERFRGLHLANKDVTSRPVIGDIEDYAHPPAPEPPDAPPDFWPVARRVLEPRSLRILELRLLEGRTLAAVGAELGTYREGVRLAEKAALAAVRSAVEGPRPSTKPRGLSERVLDVVRRVGPVTAAEISGRVGVGVKWVRIELRKLADVHRLVVRTPGAAGRSPTGRRPNAWRAA